MKQNNQLALVVNNTNVSPEQRMRDLGSLNLQLAAARINASNQGLTAVWGVLYEATRQNEKEQKELLAQHPELLGIFVNGGK